MTKSELIKLLDNVPDNEKIYLYNRGVLYEVGGGGYEFAMYCPVRETFIVKHNFEKTVRKKFVLDA